MSVCLGGDESRQNPLYQRGW